MKQARFTEGRITVVLPELEAGAKPADLARRYGISEATLYNEKALTLLGRSQCALRSCTNRGP